MADFEEVIAFLGNTKPVRDSLNKLSRDLPRQVRKLEEKVEATFNPKIQLLSEKTLKGRLGQFSKEAARINKEFTQANAEVKELANTAKNIFKTRKALTIKPQFAPDAVDLDQEGAVSATIKNFRKVERAKKNQASRLKAINKDVAQSSMREEKADAEFAIRTATMEVQRKRKLAQQEARDKAEAERVAIAARNQSLVTRRATSSRALRIGAGVAGAFGNFQVASGLFTASTALQGVDKDLFGDINPRQIATLTGATLAFTGAIGGLSVAAFSAKKALDFEDELAKLSTLLLPASASASELESTLDKTAQSAVRLSTRFNVDLTEAVEGFSTALSAGIAADELERFGQQAGVLATALGVSFSESTDILTTLKDSYELQIGDLNRINNTLFATVDEGKVVISDLITSLGRVAPVASGAGVSIEDLLSALAFLTRQGFKPSRSVTSISRAIEGIIDPSQKAKKTFDALGLQTGRAAFEGKTFVEVFDEIRRVTGGNAEVISQLFPRAQAFRAAQAFTLTTDQAENLREAITNTFDDTAITAANRALDSTKVRFERIQKAITGQAALSGQGILADIERNIFELVGAEDALESVDRFNVALLKVQNTVSSFIGGLRTVGDAIGTVFSSIASPTDIFTNIDAFAANTEKTLAEIGQQSIELARQADNVEDAVDILRKSLGDTGPIDALFGDGLSENELTKLAEKIIKAREVDELTTSIEDLAGALDTKLRSALDDSSERLSKLNKQITESTAEIEKIEQDLAIGKLTVEEKAIFDAVDNAGKLISTRFGKVIAQINKQAELDFTQILTPIEAEFARIDAEGVGGIIGRIDSITAKIQSVIDTGIVDPTPLVELQDRLANLAKPTEVGGVVTPTSIAKQAETAEKIFKDLRDVVLDVNSSTEITTDNFRMLLEQGAIPVGELENEARELLTQLDAIDTKQKEILSGTDLRALSNDLRKQVEDASSEVDKLLNKDPEETEKSIADLSKELLSFDKRIKETKKGFDALLFGIGQLPTELDAESAAESVQLVQMLTAERDKLKELKQQEAEVQEKLNEKEQEQVKIQEEREKIFLEQRDKVLDIEQKLADAQKKFEEDKTNKLREQVEKRRAILDAFATTRFDLEEKKIADELKFARNERQQQRIAQSGFQSAETAAREAIERGDLSAAQAAFDRARLRGQDLSGLFGEGSRRGGMVAERTNATLLELNDLLQDLALTQNEREVRDIGKTRFTKSDIARELAEELEADEDSSPLVSVDKSNNEFRITITNPSDFGSLGEIVDKVLDERQSREALGTNFNTFDKNRRSNQQAPRVQAQKPVGGKAGT